MGSKISKKKDENEWVQKSIRKMMKMNGFKNLQKKKMKMNEFKNLKKRKMKMNGFKNLQKTKDENEWV
jgi:hypothetical protein